MSSSGESKEIADCSHESDEILFKKNLSLHFKSASTLESGAKLDHCDGDCHVVFIFGIALA